MLMRYKIWNPNQFAGSKLSPSASYEEIVNFEKLACVTLSTEVVTSNIEEIVDAFLVLCGIDLSYHITHKKVCKLCGSQPKVLRAHNTGKVSCSRTSCELSEVELTLDQWDILGTSQEPVSYN